MRHRYRVSLYDSDELDRDLIDYIDGSQRRQELFRSLLRVGYSVLIRKEDDATAYLSSLSKEDLVKLSSIGKVNNNERRIDTRLSLDRPYSQPTEENTDQTSPLKDSDAKKTSGLSINGEYGTHSNEFNDEPVDFMDILKA